MTHELDLGVADTAWRWRILDRPSDRPLVMQFVNTYPHGWAVERVTAWELPRWSEPFEERLRAAGSVEQVRAVLGGASGTRVTELPNSRTLPARSHVRPPAILGSHQYGRGTGWPRARRR